MERVKFRSTGIKDKERIYEILKKEGYSVYEWYDAPGTYYPTHTHRSFLADNS